MQRRVKSLRLTLKMLVEASHGILVFLRASGGENEREALE